MKIKRENFVKIFSNEIAENVVESNFFENTFNIARLRVDRKANIIPNDILGCSLGEWMEAIDTPMIIGTRDRYTGLECF